MGKGVGGTNHMSTPAARGDGATLPRPMPTGLSCRRLRAQTLRLRLPPEDRSHGLRREPRCEPLGSCESWRPHAAPSWGCADYTSVGRPPSEAPVRANDINTARLGTSARVVPTRLSGANRSGRPFSDVRETRRGEVNRAEDQIRTPNLGGSSWFKWGHAGWHPNPATTLAAA